MFCFFFSKNKASQVPEHFPCGNNCSSSIPHNTFFFSSWKLKKVICCGHGKKNYSKTPTPKRQRCKWCCWMWLFSTSQFLTCLRPGRPGISHSVEYYSLQGLAIFRPAPCFIHPRSTILQALCNIFLFHFLVQSCSAGICFISSWPLDCTSLLHYSVH